MTLTVEVPSKYDANELIARLVEAYPAAGLITRQPQSYVTPLFTPREFERALEEWLTVRQYEVLRATFEECFYEWPREVTGEQLSERLGISALTFHRHLRKAERKLLQLVFGDRDLGAADTTISSARLDP